MSLSLQRPSSRIRILEPPPDITNIEFEKCICGSEDIYCINLCQHCYDKSIKEEIDILINLHNSYTKYRNSYISHIIKTLNEWSIKLEVDESFKNFLQRYKENFLPLLDSDDSEIVSYTIKILELLS